MFNPAPNINVKLWNHDIRPDQGCQFGFTTYPEEATIIVTCQTCGDHPLAEIGLVESYNNPPHMYGTNYHPTRLPKAVRIRNQPLLRSASGIRKK